MPLIGAAAHTLEHAEDLPDESKEVAGDRADEAKQSTKHANTPLLERLPQP